MQNGIYVKKDISIWGCLHNEKVLCYKLLWIFIIHQGLSFGGIGLKIEFVVFLYELINYEIIFLLLGYVISRKEIKASENPVSLYIFVSVFV